MKTTVIAAAFAFMIGAASAASAHHTTVQYDMTRSVEVKGVVEEFEPQNPHMELTLVVTDAKGAHRLALEGQSVNNMYRMGYRRGMIKVGDTIVVDYAPMKNGSEGGLFKTVVTADGKVLGQRGPATKPA